ncbi:MAG: type II secretion system protein [Trueperaceae bacterium]|nr:type II secretion system protein [Trueperaceae bacterium]
MNSKHKKQQGLTLPEVLIAISIIGVLVGIFSTALTGNIKLMTKTGQGNQAAEVLNYFGRRVIDGDTIVLATESAPAVWDYGDLVGSFYDQAARSSFSNPAYYKVTVTHKGHITLSTAQLTEYQIDVCYKNQGEPTCIQGITYGPDLNDPERTSQLLGIS